MQGVWRDVWLREVTHKGRVVVLATTGEPLLVVSMDVTLPPEVMIPLSAARFPLELRLRDLKQYGGLGDSQCYTVLAIHRFVQLALTAFCLWRLTRLREQPTPWLPAERATPAGALSPRSFQRLHRGLRRLVWPRIVASSAPGPNSQNTAVSDEPLFRIAAWPQDAVMVPCSAGWASFCEGFEEFLDFTCEELGLKHKEAGRLQKIQALNRFLMDQLGRGGTVVLLMDEAQNLGEEVLENLCLLSNLETTTEKLLQVVLVGQPELETKLCQPGLRQLKQRIAIQCQLER
jgi:AAA domain